jgi:hypothetical protein
MRYNQLSGTLPGTIAVATALRWVSSLVAVVVVAALRNGRRSLSRLTWACVYPGPTDHFCWTSTSFLAAFRTL